VRPELKDVSQLIVEHRGICAFTGGVTDLRLPNGDYIAAEKLIQARERGWIGPDLGYTDQFFRDHPHVKREDVPAPDPGAPALPPGEIPVHESNESLQERVCKRRRKIAALLLFIGLLPVAGGGSSFLRGRDWAARTGILLGTILGMAVLVVPALYLYYRGKPTRR
jgi:hypothetical protein